MQGVPIASSVTRDRVVVLAIVGASLAVLIASLTLNVQRNIEKIEDSRAFDLMAPTEIEQGDGTVRGSRTAKLAIVVFSDFECPFCREFSEEVLPSLVARYVDAGRALLVFKQYPLVRIHPDAQRMAELTACAAQQGKFWIAHDFVFRRNQGLADMNARILADGIKADESRLEGCMHSLGPTLVAKDVQLGRTVGVRGTPTVFMGEAAPNIVRVSVRLRDVSSVASFEAAMRLFEVKAQQ